MLISLAPFVPSTGDEPASPLLLLLLQEYAVATSFYRSNTPLAEEATQSV